MNPDRMNSVLMKKIINDIKSKTCVPRSIAPSGVNTIIRGHIQYPPAIPFMSVTTKTTFAEFERKLLIRIDASLFPETKYTRQYLNINYHSIKPSEPHT